MRRILVIVAVLAVTLCGAARANTNQDFSIPIELTRSGHLVVELVLNGEIPARAIFDTGATFALIGRRTASRIGLIEEDDGPTVDIVGIGVRGTFPVVDIAQVEFGGRHFHELKAALNQEFSLQPADTVLPAALLPHRTLDFDFPNASLTAYDRQPDRIYRATTSHLPVTWINDLPFVDVEVNGKHGLALIDTGASNTFINSAFARAAARSDKDFGLLEVMGSTGTVTPLRILSSRRFTIGDFQVRHFNVIVLDPSFLESCGLEDQPVMILGLDILSQFRLQLDRGGNELRVSKPNRRARTTPAGLYFDYN